MDTNKLKDHYQKNVVIDNNILTDFMELNAALEIDYMNTLNQLFNKIIIPTPILDNETFRENLRNLKYDEGVINGETGYSILIELNNLEDKSAKQLSEYDRYLIAIAFEKDLLAVSNDKPMREICKKKNIEITGTLGIISSAYENQLISFKQMEEAYRYLFSEESSCYLNNELKIMVYEHYSIKNK